ncbi:hypothetical protein [uncultured Rhodoblastus sp.]|uniref:hypothetical protein n=1 Tax=uncultured Rhodoblastus sp. TaxID=543037 RepID=UPI0025FCF2A9|nr:hypothetical protein [uncultured Rhodoblastus sp.]
MDYFKGPREEDARESSAAIQVGVKAGSDAEEARWTFYLTVFFRVVALWWIVEGLAQWRRILAPAGGSFVEYSAGSIAATTFFAVLDLVAAVGLWLIAPWGGVVWLLTLMAQFFVATIKPTFFFGGGGIRWLDGLLLAVYLFLSWRANVASGEFGTLDRLFDKALGLLRSPKGNERSM